MHAFLIMAFLLAVPVLGDEGDGDLRKAAETAKFGLEKIKTACTPSAVCPVSAGAPKADETGLDALSLSVQKGEAHPLTDYLKLFSTAKSKDLGNPWAICLDPSMNNHPSKKGPDGNILPRCAPDTLYSWAPLVKIRGMQRKVGDGPWKTRPFFDNALYLARSPAASFGYGSNDESGGYALRIKLKAGVQFKYISGGPPSCPEIPDSEASNTVYIWTWVHNRGAPNARSGQDFVLCSVGPIRSWSYGTREFYDEFSKDMKRILDPAHKNDWLSYVRQVDETGIAQPVLWNLGTDHHAFSTEQATHTFEKQLVAATTEDSGVYYNPDTPAPANEAAKRKEHFATKTPSWFNDHAESTGSR